MSNELSVILNPQTWDVMRSQAEVLVKSGFLPSSVKTPEQAIAIIMKGYEVGLPPMQAFSHINIIQGKPAASPESQLALIYKNCSGANINFVRLADNECIIEASRPGGKKTIFKFDEEDAKKAGLLNKDNWKKYPRAMFRSRCVSEMARTMFPDAIMGLSYTPEELNPDIIVSADCEVIKVPRDTKPNKDAISKIEEQKNVELFDNDNSAHLTRLFNFVDALATAKKMPAYTDEQKRVICDLLHGEHFIKSEIEKILASISEAHN